MHEYLPNPSFQRTLTLTVPPLDDTYPTTTYIVRDSTLFIDCIPSRYATIPRLQLSYNFPFPIVTLLPPLIEEATPLVVLCNGAIHYSDTSYLRDYLTPV